MFHIYSFLSYFKQKSMEFVDLNFHDNDTLVRHERILIYTKIRCCTRDEGGPLEVGLQEQASNHLTLHR